MLKIDLHIHSIASGHAYGTIYDIIRDAKSKGMDMIGITDHGPALSGSQSEIHFNMGHRAPKNYECMDILWGCEANIVDDKGTIDIQNKTLKKLDILLVGMHEDITKDLGRKKNTENIIKCFERYPILIFTHPCTIKFEYDFDKVCQAALDNGILLELNLSSLANLELGYTKEKLSDIKKMIDIVKKNNKKLIINSDAHFLAEIGDDSLLKKYWKELGLNKDMIINNYPEELKRIIKSKNLKNFSLK